MRRFAKEDLLFQDTEKIDDDLKPEPPAVSQSYA